MGNGCTVCCVKCLAYNTCCKCWCGCFACCLGSYKKENLEEKYDGKEQFLADIKTWKTGDIILQHSSGSWHSQTLSDSPWTHIGLVYVCKEEEEKGYTADFESIEGRYPGEKEKKPMKAKFDDSGAKILIFQAIMSDIATEPNNALCSIMTTVFSDAERWFHNRLWNEELTKEGAFYENFYFGHRSLNEELSDTQKQNLENAICKLIANPYGGQSKSDFSALGAAIDFGCCYCPCMGESGTDESRLDKLFCSEAVGYVLQEAGIVTKEMAADEMMPTDFSSARMADWSVDHKDPYGKEKIYG